MYKKNTVSEKLKLMGMMMKMMLMNSYQWIELKKRGKKRNSDTKKFA
jgi:hypothetical protein